MSFDVLDRTEEHSGLELRQRNPMWLVLLFVLVGFSIATLVSLLAGSRPYGVLAAAGGILLAIPLVALPMAIYLSIKDRVALKEGTWSISEESSTGLKIGAVPIEEILFFIITSWVSAQGIILLTDERSPGEIKKLKTRLLTLLHPFRKRR